jgi:hypothetical protein
LAGPLSGPLAGPLARLANWNDCVRDSHIISRGGDESHEVTTWKVSNGFVTVWNTFHCSVPDGAIVGIVLHASSQEAFEEFSQASGHPFGILLSQYTTSGSLDSPFQWIGYNLSCGKISTQFPCLAF